MKSIKSLGGVEVLGVNISKVGKFHELPRKSIHFLKPPVGSFTGKVLKKYLRNAVILSDYTNILGKAG